MKKGKEYLKYKKHRVIFSDVLPYEIPITFSNRYLYKFLIKNGIELKDNKIIWDTNNNIKDKVLEEIIKILFGLDKSKIQIINNSIYIDKMMTTIPFIYKISHKINDFRELSIIHPKNQLFLVNFYDKYKESIKYYSNISPFSIRKPYKIAKYIFDNDYIHKIKKSSNENSEVVEMNNKEYENLKSFFSYKKYSNIYKFYESYQYQRCEKKFNELLVFDISKCFDSIYTHSISWAIFNKEIVKDNLKKSEKTFPGIFDKFMQNINYGETNGILIGPEFSRIFAELILQKIDKKIYNKLKEMEKYHKKDYEIFRYVDDYFLFYNDISVKDKIFELYKLTLKDFKMNISETKIKIYNKPIITEISIAKYKINDLLNKYLNLNIKKKEKIDQETGEVIYKISWYKFINSEYIITRFKSIIKKNNIEYKDILNYTLTLIEKKTNIITENYIKIEKKENLENRYIESLLVILDISFFLYNVSPRVNSTIKILLILKEIIKNLKTKGSVNFDNKHLIFKKIYDEIFLILNKNKPNEYTQIETLYLLIVLTELGKEYRLNSDFLKKFFNLDAVKKGDIELNYFVITVLLYYIKDIKRYDEIRLIIKDHINFKFNKYLNNNWFNRTELILLLFDTLSCPYLDIKFKRELLEFIGIKSYKDDIINREKIWFTKWTNFNFDLEIEQKRSKEVYS